MMDLVALAQENGWSGPGPWWPIFPVLWFLVVIAVIVLVNRLCFRRWRHTGWRSGEDRLAERYVAGDIDEHEYRERLAVLKENR